MKKQRTKNAVFVGKGIDKGLHPKDCIPIDRRVAADQGKLAELLNECEYVYQYDMVSAMSEIARLCGCKVKILADKYTKDDYRKSYEPGINGISFSMDEDTPLSVSGFKRHYKEMKGNFYNKKLDFFIKKTQAL